jgi:DNA-binding NarL/FixJ family response regulator
MDQSHPIRVLLVDDHQMFREGLKRLLDLERDLRVVGEVGDGVDVVPAVERLEPDVVLLDIAMPSMDGVTLTETLAARWPNTAVLILTGHTEDLPLFRSIQAGARGYLIKALPGMEVVRAIRIVRAGGAVLEPMMAAKLVDEFRRLANSPAASHSLAGLSNAEIEMLRLVAASKSNREIGEELGFAEKTIKNHLTAVFARIGVSDRILAASFAREHGIL